MKKGISVVAIIVVILASVGFVFKNDITYQLSPKLYLSNAIVNTTKKINNTKNVKEYSKTIKAENKVFADMTKTSTKTNIYLKDDSIANMYLGNLKPSIEIIDDVNNKIFKADFSVKNNKPLAFYLGEDNSIIHLNKNDYSIENKTFVNDYNTWYDINEKALNELQSISGNTNAFSKLPPTYDKQISYTSFKNEIASISKYYDEQYNKELTKKFKNLLSNATYTKENSAEPKTKQISIIVKEQDAKDFIENLYTTNNFYTGGDLNITFVIENNLIKDFTIYSLDNENYKARIGVNSVDNYLKDFYITIIAEQIETEIINISINQITKDLIDVTMNLDIEDSKLSINYILDHSKQIDNIKIVVGGAAGTLLGGNIELIGTYKVTSEEFLFSLDTLKLPNQSNINVGFIAQTLKLDESLEIPKSNVKFFNTKLETITSDLFMVSKSLGF